MAYSGGQYGLTIMSFDEYIILLKNKHSVLRIIPNFIIKKLLQTDDDIIVRHDR